MPPYFAQIMLSALNSSIICCIVAICCVILGWRQLYFLLALLCIAEILFCCRSHNKPAVKRSEKVPEYLACSGDQKDTLVFYVGINTSFQ